MPLIEGKSRAVISANISELMHRGYPQKQAIAISMRNAGVKRKGVNTMARRRRKHAKHRKSYKRARAAKRAYRGSALHKYNMRRRKKHSKRGRRRRGRR